MRPLDASVSGEQSRLDVTPHHHVEGFNRARRNGVSVGLRPRRTRPLTKGSEQVECPALSDQNGTVHHSRHLTHIARPTILGKHLDVVVGNRYDAKAEAVRGPLGEVLKCVVRFRSSAMCCCPIHR
jgi:hypothetical protein